MAQFKRFSGSESENYNSGYVGREGELTWDPDNGLRIHDGNESGGIPVGISNFYDLTNRPFGNTAVHDLIGGSSSNDNGKFLQQDSTGTSVWAALPSIPADVSDLTDTTGLLGGGGTSLPSDASGYLNNNGSGTLTWVPGNPSGSGVLPYNGVTVFSNTSVEDWTAYTLSGTMDAFYDWNNSYTTITLSSEPAYGKQITANTKTLWINDTKIDNKDYIIIEFPASPAVGDVFTVPMVSPTTIVNAGFFVVGETYTIVSTGTTSWTSIGASYGGAGQAFVATGTGSGTGTASTSAGAKKVVFKPQSGARAQTMAQGSVGAIVFGQGGDYDFMYIDLSGQNAGNPVTWVYAGVINSIPTWYQFYF